MTNKDLVTGPGKKVLASFFIPPLITQSSHDQIFHPHHYLGGRAA